MKKGFTLIELIIALSVITIGVVGTFAVIQKIIISTASSSSKLMASCLAQEGIEVIRNIRDSNWLDPSLDWDERISVVPEGNPDVHYLDYRSVDFPDLANCNGKEYLKYSDSEGFYICSDDLNAKFKRKIIITKEDVDKMKVLVKVEWQELGKTNVISVQEDLYNWYQF